MVNLQFKYSKGKGKTQEPIKKGLRNMNNTDIRQAIKEAGLFYWQVADLLNIGEYTFSRKLRKELPDEEKQRIIKAIENYKRKG